MRGLARSAAALVVLVVVGGVLGLPPLASATKPAGEPANPFAYKLTDRPEPGSSGGTVGTASVAPGGFDRSGELPQYTFWSQQLDDRLAIRVNLESGNLIVEQNDLTLKGVGGYDLQITRYWNSLKDGVDSAYGMGWSLGTGADVGFNNNPDGSKTVFGPSGWVLNFAQKVGDPNTWVASAGVNADMHVISCSCPQNGDIVLQFHQPRVSYVFDPQGVLLWTQDSHGTYTDNGTGNVQDFFYTFPSNHPFYANKITHWPYGQSVTFSADPATSLVTSMQDPKPRTWSYGYDGSRHDTSYTDPAGHVTHYGYTGDDMTSITDPNGNVTAISYVTYGNGDRVASIARGGFTWSFSYADTASPPTTTLTDPNGHTWTYTADSGGNGEIVKAVDQLNRTEQSQYTANGDVSQTTNAANGVSDYSYNANNSLVQAQGPAGAGGRQTSSFDYDTSPTSANPYDPSAYHDMTHAGDWQYGYNGSEDLTSKGEGTTPPGQNQVSFTYSNWGEILTAKNALGGTWTYTYTSHNLTGIAPPTGSGLGSQSFGYDTIHRLTSATDGRTPAVTTTYTYDNLDRVTQETIGTLTFSFGYDNNGNLTSRTDPNGTTTYTYDALNRLTGETKSSGNVGYSYDGAGNLTSMNEPSGTWQYGYDPANRLTSITEPASPGGRSITYTYTGETQTKITFPNNATETMTYDVGGQLSEIIGKTAAGATATDFTYAYSGDRRISMSDVVAGTTTNYTYDSNGRLKTASGPSGYSYTYGYDVDGNMTSKTVNGTTTSYSFNNANLLTTSGFTYDGNGDLTKTTTPAANTTMSYNAADQTTNVTVPNVTNLNMTYAGLGQSERLSAGTVNFLNDKLGIATRNSGGSTDTYTRSPDGTILGEKVGTSNYYFLVDGLGSVIALTDSSGNTLKDSGGVNTFLYRYEPFGKPLNDPPASFPTQPFRFAGYYWGSTYGHYKVGERYYDPTTGRWTQTDPIENPLDQHGWNPYIYAGDDPVNATDPSGMADVPIKPVPAPLQTNPFHARYRFSHRQIRPGEALAITLDVGPGRVKAVGRFYSKTGGYKQHVIADAICDDPPCFGMISAIPGSRTQRLESVEIYADGGLSIFNSSLYNPSFG